MILFPRAQSAVPSDIHRSFEVTFASTASLLDHPAPTTTPFKTQGTVVATWHVQCTADNGLPSLTLEADSVRPSGTAFAFLEEALEPRSSDRVLGIDLACGRADRPWGAM